GLVMAPALLTWAPLLYPPLGRRGVTGRWPPRRRAEAGALLAGLVATGLLVFGGPLSDTIGGHPLEYTMFPFVIWAALRFGRRGAAAVTLVASALAIWGTLRATGPFGAGPVHERLLLLQVFLGVMAVTALLLSAALTERRRNEQGTAALHAVT